MKKVISLALAAAMAAGLSVSSFALWPDPIDLTTIKDFAPNYDLSDGVRNYTPYRQVVDMGDLFAMDKPQLVIDLKKEMFDGIPGTTVTQYRVYAVDLNKLVTKGLINSGDVAGIKAGSTNAVRVGALNTALAAKLGSSSTYQIDVSGSEDALKTAASRYNHIGTLKLITVADLSAATLNGTSEVFFALNLGSAGELVLSNNSTSGTNRNLTAEEIRKSKLNYGTTVAAGSAAIKSIALDQKDGQIVMKLQNEWISTKSQDVEVLIYLKAGSKRLDEKGVTVLATLKNPEIEVYANHDFVDIHQGYIAKPVEFNSKIAVDIGNGVTIHTKLFRDKLYYGITSREDDEAATVVFNQYKDVSNVITLKTVGFANTNDYVTLSTDYTGYYVYDVDLNYLGKADEQLKFSTRYYLADQKLDLVDEDEDDDDDDEEPTNAGNPSTGGDNSSPNVNANPGTGR